MSARSLQIGLGLLVVLGLGCTLVSEPDWLDDDAARPEADSDQDGPRRVDADTLQPLNDRVVLFTDDPEQPDDGALDVEVEQKQQRWHIRVGGLYETHLIRESDGSRRAEAELDFEQDVRVEYDPPILVLPAELRIGEPVKDETHMVIRDRRTGRVRQQGPCEVTIELKEFRTVTTPAGPREAWVVKTTRKADLGAADFRVVITEAYVPDAGLVAKHTDRLVRIFGAIPQREVEHLLLMPPVDEQAESVDDLPEVPAEPEPSSEQAPSQAPEANEEGDQ